MTNSELDPVEYFGEGKNLLPYRRTGANAWYRSCNKCRNTGQAIQCTRCGGTGVDPNSPLLTSQHAARSDAVKRQEARHRRSNERNLARSNTLVSMATKRGHAARLYPAAVHVVNEYHKLIERAKHSDDQETRDRRAREVTPAIHAAVEVLHWPSKLKVPFTREMAQAALKDYATCQNRHRSLCPIGRIRVEGTVVSIRRTNHPEWGIRWVFTVLDRRGFTVHGTIPGAILPGQSYGEQEGYYTSGVREGSRVSFDASLTPSTVDRKFGWFKHANKAVLEER